MNGMDNWVPGDENETWEEAGMSSPDLSLPMRLESTAWRTERPAHPVEPGFLRDGPGPATPTQPVDSANRDTRSSMDSDSQTMDMHAAYREYARLCALHGLHANSSAAICLYSHYKVLKLSRGATERDLIPIIELLVPPKNSDQASTAIFVKEVDLTSLKMGSVAALLIAKLIRGQPSIRKLHLANNFMRDDGAVLIFEALKENSTLEYLDLRGNRITQHGVLRIAEMLKYPALTSPRPKQAVCGSGLKELVMVNNALMQQGVDEINRACEQRGILVREEGNLILAEILNSITHGVGLVVSGLASAVMIDEAQELPTRLYVSILIFCVALCSMFGSSCFYHTFFRIGPIQSVLKVLDHCAIFLLIAGTYTPILLKFIWSPDHPSSPMGPALFFLVWGFGLAGIVLSSGILKKHTPNRRTRAALALAMGWLVVFSVRVLWQRMPPHCLSLLVLGGLSYTAGVPFYVRGHDFAMYHVVWHVTVMLGALFHYLMILNFVVRGNAGVTFGAPTAAAGLVSA